MSGLTDQISGAFFRWASTAMGVVGPDYIFLAVLIFTLLGVRLAEYGRRLKQRALTIAGGVLSSVAAGWSCSALWILSPCPLFYLLGFGAFAVLTIFITIMIGVWHYGIERRRSARDDGAF